MGATIHRTLCVRKILLIAMVLFGFTPMGGSAQTGIRGPDHGIAIPDHPTYEAIPVCYDFRCRTRRIVSLSVAEWESVTGWFSEPDTTAAAERDRIRRAVGWMEVMVGRHLPTHQDLPLNEIPVPYSGSGQLDCIDESVNTTVYLRLFQAYGYLRHHRVIEEAYRRALFDQHWAGQIREMDSGTRYVVDSWFQPNGYLPIIQPSKIWEDISLYTALMDNRPDE